MRGKQLGSDGRHLVHAGIQELRQPAVEAGYKLGRGHCRPGHGPTCIILDFKMVDVGMFVGRRAASQQMPQCLAGQHK